MSGQERTVSKAWYLGLVALAGMLVLLLPVGNPRSAVVFVLLWALPGWAWGCFLDHRWLLGLGLGTGVNLLLALILSYLPGPIPFALSLGTFALSALLPAFLLRSSRMVLPSSSPGLLLLMLVAGAYRLIHLGYSEFQGDEGVIMIRTAMAIAGNEEQLFLHQKAPAEILIPVATWCLAGGVNEFWVRLPFAWLSLLAVVAVAQLGTRWFDRGAGVAAGLILSLSGLHIAFARIVQNQSIVVWMGLLALLALDDYRQHRRTLDLLLGAGLAAMSLLGHYDALLLLPATAALALPWQRGQHLRLGRPANLYPYLLALLLGAAILAPFYMPFALHPNFAKTVRYLSQDRVQAEGAAPYFNAEKIWGVSTLYNSTYYYVLLLVLVFGSLFAVRRYPLSPFAWLAFGVPFGFYLLLVNDPRTHVYTFYAGASLLAGATLSALWERVRRFQWRWAILASEIGLLALNGGYAWMLFVDHTPEYLRTFPEHKSPLYWTSYDQIFEQGLFGFPYRAGWHAIGDLVAQGVISGLYASNEEQEITDWYTRQAPRTHCPRPDVYIIAENVQDNVHVEWEEIERDYTLAGRVLVHERPRIQWYTRNADGSMTVTEPIEVDEAAHRQWWRPAEVVPSTFRGIHRIDQTLGEKIELLGYDLDDTEARPGGWVQVTLYWRPLEPLVRNYQVFVHLYDGQKLWSQHDGAPECTINATTRWEPGHIVPDQHLVPMPGDMPLGPMPVLVGMYDLRTKERLPIPGTTDHAIHLADVNVRASD